ncbi:MAG TPA: hypothetical protein VGL63_07435 [Streptosporangiaceae bacterium]|jgi:hypothetical protein
MSPTTPAELSVTQAEQADLERLAAELSTRGLKTMLVTGDGRPPCLHVVNPEAAALSERVFAQADFFWWPWAQVIDRRDQPAAAAAAITRVLRTV